MRGLMMDYPLTIDRILEHANRLYPDKTIHTKLPDGSLHHYSYSHLYRRVKRLGNVLENLGVDELAEHLLAEFPRFWLPDEVVLLQEIPKTSVGKFDKKVLRHRYAEGKLA